MENKRACCFCSQNDAKYTCPRCNALYCSKTCYQSQTHINCSEQFYKQCVEDDLRMENADTSKKKHMLEILQRFQNEENNDDIDSDDDLIPDLSERLQNIDLDDADEVWNCLSQQEKQEFQAILKSGDISQLIPEYDPWWCKRYETKVEELESFSGKEKKYEHICPTIIEIVPFNSLSKTEPSSCIMWNIVNILAAYVFTVRRYLGEHNTDEGANTISKICMNLNYNQNFENSVTAIDSVIYHANNNTDITCTPEEGVLIHEDINKILAGPEKNAVAYYILAALSDMRQILTEVVKMKKGSKTSQKEFSGKFSSPFVTIEKSKLRKSIRKLTFYISWINEFYNADSIFKNLM